MKKTIVDTIIGIITVIGFSLAASVLVGLGFGLFRLVFSGDIDSVLHLTAEARFWSGAQTGASIGGIMGASSALGKMAERATVARLLSGLLAGSIIGSCLAQLFFVSVEAGLLLSIIGAFVGAGLGIAMKKTTPEQTRNQSE